MTWKGLVSVDPDMCWSEAWPMLEPALARQINGFSSEQLFQKIVAKEFALWKAGDGQGYVVTCVESGDPPTFRTLYLGGSNLPAWLDQIDDLERVAQHNGCCEHEIDSRPGFARLLKPRGYRLAAVKLIKDLNSG
jgi:hypothetical protein